MPDPEPEPPPPYPPRPPGTRILGVLGGIASGKSAVARILAGPEGLVIDADVLAREVLATPEVCAELARRFGPAVLDAAGRPDRGALAARVFASRADREALEALTHPRVRARIRAALEAAIARRVPRIVLDVPLLVEHAARHGLLELCDELWFVDAEPGVRDARAQRTRGWEAGEVARRERSQLPLESKRGLSDVVIQNTGSLAELESAVRRALAGRAAR